MHKINGIDKSAPLEVAMCEFKLADCGCDSVAVKAGISRGFAQRQHGRPLVNEG